MEEQNNSYVIKKEDGHFYFVYGKREFIIGNRNDVELDSGEIPPIRIEQIPNDIQFKMIYRGLIIFSPNRYTAGGTACVAIPDDTWRVDTVTKFKEFLIQNDLFGRTHDKDISGIPFIGIKIQGETLKIVIERAKMTIDEFYGQQENNIVGSKETK